MREKKQPANYESKFRIPPGFGAKYLPYFARIKLHLLIKYFGEKGVREGLEECIALSNR